VAHRQIGTRVTFCCLNAVLRDYARLGLLLAHDGNWRGRQLIPAAWIAEATTKHAGQAHLCRHRGTVLRLRIPDVDLPGERRMFAFLGVRGQAIYVDPKSRLVMVHTAVRKQSSGDPGSRESIALWQARFERSATDAVTGTELDAACDFASGA